MAGGTRAASGAWAIAAAAALLIASACTPTPTEAGPPAVVAFQATRSSAPAPLTTTFTWTVTGPVGLSCGLDADGDGVEELQIDPCASGMARTVTFATPGTRTARLRVTDGTSSATSAPLTLSVTAPSPDAFGITVRFDPSVTPAQQVVFSAAAQRWAQVVRTGLPDAAVDISADECGTGAPAFQGNVDDLLIDATVVAIDGSGGVLGQAGPCLVRSGGGLPVYGTMEFDSADVADMSVDGTLGDVILHEMGHVLGIGTVWDALISGAGTSDPRFDGMAARGVWSLMVGGAADPVQVEADGGPGTAGAHWRESTFANELMTGWISPGANPLSGVTAGGLADLGYGVDLGGADAFPAAARRAPSSPGERITERLIHPIGVVDPIG